MGTLTAGQIFGICLDAGFTRDQAVTWTAIALAESGGDPAAHNPHGEDSWGLWQINVDPAVRPNRWGDLTDPVINARAAYEVSRGGTDLRPWTVTHDSNAGTDRDYRNFMDEARAAAGGGELGDFSGVRGADEAPPAPGDDPAAPAAPAPAPAPDDPDTDLDGATDAFEMAHGTDPLLPDSDADGLTDGFELTHGLDATTFDTDGDGLSDRHEVRVGSDAASFDTDGDGVVDAVELAVGRDPRHGLAPGTAAGDQDDDGLSDAWEAAIGTDPTTGDSDGDGVADGVALLADLRALAQAPAPPVRSFTGVDPDVLAAAATGGPADPVRRTGPTGLSDLSGLTGRAGAAVPAAEDDATRQFLDAALAQTGDDYVFGGEAAPGDADPDAFDCSELTQWAAAQVGIDLPDGSWLQYLELERQGALVPVEEALRTPGALLFSFSSEPTAGAGRPAEAHVAISLGNGATIEARSTRDGVGSWEAGDRFTYAAVLPGLAGPAPVGAADPALPDSDGDGLVDAFEMSLGTDPALPDSDGDGLGDGFELGLGLDGLRLDADGDGLSDAWEVRLGTDPNAVDSDHDGVADGLEAALGRDARFGLAGIAEVAGTADGPAATVVLDRDGDGLSDAWEATVGSDPLAADSDHDGLADPLELAGHTDPDDPDTDDDGVIDRWDDD